MGESSESGQREPPISSTGLTVVADASMPRLDVVFVHGFKGHPERTWVQKTRRAQPEYDEERPAKYQKLGFLSRQAKTDSEVAVFWPRDILPSVLPDARILTYGYDTKIRHRTGEPVSTHTVYDIAWDFLVALEAERRKDPARPLLFIVHSLGGIVVKEMLRRAHTCHTGQAYLSATLDPIIGIMFFGTPHAGADPRGLLLKVAEKAYRALGYSPNQQIVDSLLPSSERLRELRDTFGTLAEKHDWIIHSFQEQYSVKAIGCKVVEDGSSYLNIPRLETAEHIGRDHMGMSRFSGHDDPEFKKVAAALHRMAEPAFRQPLQQVATLTQHEIKEFLDSLKFEQIDSRHETIKKAHAKTCKWLQQNGQYVNWLDPSLLKEHHGFFWIKGKPGTGKSTIMKFALGQMKKTSKDRTILNFFFNARGEEMERSTKGLYRSLLLQLLELRPELQALIESIPSFRRGGTASAWNTESLKAAFEHVIQASGQTPVTCFIDALDECDEFEIRDMVKFLEQLGDLAVSQNGHFSVCLSSRHYPHITIEHGLELVLDGHEGHVQDITNYIEGELKIGRSKLATKVKEELQEKASGVFMWVVLVVDILNKEHDRGRIHALRRRLHELPADLHRLFRDILLRDSYGKEELLLCIQWVLFAKTPLKPEELYYAILCGSDPEGLTVCDRTITDLDVMKRYILDCSKGLAEVTKSKKATVQFIHESVRDFLLKDSSPTDIWPHLREGLPGQSHDQLKKCCLQYLALDAAGHPWLADGLSDEERPASARLKTLDAFPFLEYAVRNMLYHADKAQELSICQKEFVGSFPLAQWIEHWKIVEQYGTRKYEKRPTLLYIMAEHGFANLTPVQFSVPDCVHDTGERYGCPLGAALAAKNNDRTIKAIQEALLTALPLSENTRGLLKRTDHPKIHGSEATTKTGSYYATHIDRRTWQRHYTRFLNASDTSNQKSDLTLVPSASPSDLYVAIEKNHQAVLRALLDLSDRHVIDISYQIDRSIWEACDKGDVEILEVLLAHEARKTQVLKTTPVLDVTKALDLNEGYYSTFIRAIDQERFDVVNLLLKSNKLQVISDGVASWPVLAALENIVEQGNAEIVRAIAQELPLNLNALKLDGDAVSRLSITAVLANDFMVFDACLATRSLKNLDIGTARRSLLSLASSIGHISIVQRLIGIGDAELNHQDISGWTPLAEACHQGHAEVVKLLLGDNRIRPNIATNNGQTALHLAAISGKQEILRMLLETDGLNPKLQNNHGETALHVAARHGHDNFVRFWLEMGQPGSDFVNKEGNTPLHVATRAGHSEVVKVLLEIGNVDIQARNEERNIAFLEAVKGKTPGHDAVLRLLLTTNTATTPQQVADILKGLVHSDDSEI